MAGVKVQDRAIAASGLLDTMPSGDRTEAAPPPQQVQRLLAHLQRDSAECRAGIAARTNNSLLADFLIATPQEAHLPQDVFPRLRWGGLYVFASDRRRQVEQLARQFEASGFALETHPTYIRSGYAGLPIPLLSRKTHYFIARKTQLVPPGQYTDRFTYQVQLARSPDPKEPWVVHKRVPSLASVVARLSRKFPEIPLDVIERRARKFTDKVFPTFLTREAAFLMILQERLPSGYARRVPRAIKVEKDERGFVQELWMNWLRNGGEPLSQLEFAHQSADLLRMVHDIARIIHLDLRLDNFVITNHGVGFVDFGSAVRDDENLSVNPLLGSLFEELMRTSQIQRMLNQMTLSGHVTSDVIRHSHQKVDKAVDYFYLAVQFNYPRSNPDLIDLIRYDPQSEEAQQLSLLNAEILRPRDPAHPTFRSAKDILHGIERLQLKLKRRHK